MDKYRSKINQKEFIVIQRLKNKMITFLSNNLLHLKIKWFANMMKKQIA